jgi:hypothetical protein
MGLVIGICELAEQRGRAPDAERIPDRLLGSFVAETGHSLPNAMFEGKQARELGQCPKPLCDWTRNLVSDTLSILW